jgi:hypothetical protein
MLLIRIRDQSWLIISDEHVSFDGLVISYWIRIRLEK